MADTPELSVVPLYDKAMAGDVAGSLRRAADSIESETETDSRTIAMIAVQVGENGSVKSYGWGRTDKFHAIGALTAGIADIGGWADQ